MKNDASDAQNAAAEERKKLYEKHRDEIWKRQVSNADNFDKAILAYSSGGLAVSIGFLKDFIPASVANFPWLLYSSWALFVVAIIITIVSFEVSQRGLDAREKQAHRYYIENDETARNEQSIYERVLRHLPLGAGSAFIVAVICTAVFVATNLERGSEMKGVTIKGGTPIPSLQQKPSEMTQKGAPIPNLQQIPGQVPASTPATTPAPAAPAATSTPASKQK